MHWRHSRRWWARSSGSTQTSRFTTPTSGATWHTAGLIWQTGALPTTEPFMPLARGIPLVDTAWLTQVAGYLVIARWGPAGDSDIARGGNCRVLWNSGSRI